MSNSLLKGARRSAVFVALAAAGFVCAPTSTSAANRVVLNCSDDLSNGGHGPAGSLRDAVTGAMTNDTIDMTTLACSKITLNTSAIPISQNTLFFQGPGADNLTIQACDGAACVATDRVFNHTTNGALILHDLTVANGRATAPGGLVTGGCINTLGVASLYHVNVKNCSLNSKFGYGGGVYAAEGIIVHNSKITGNLANLTVNAGIGGGLSSKGGITVKYSTLSDNHSNKSGGAIYAKGSVNLYGSTISGNSSKLGGGAMIYLLDGASKTTKIINSTISDNHGETLVGGIETNTEKVAISNSTIAFNTATLGRSTVLPNPHFAPGLAIVAVAGGSTVTMQSTVIANNYYGVTEYDASADLRKGAVTFSASDNFVRFNGLDGTLSNACPLLGPLRDNGGPTQTRAPHSRSLLIDSGDNAANLPHDQRADDVNQLPPAAYPRVSGAFADIGAFEVQQDDAIFDTDFEGCGDLVLP